jgi:hypothetical protein
VRWSGYDILDLDDEEEKRAPIKGIPDMEERRGRVRKEPWASPRDNGFTRAKLVKENKSDESSGEKRMSGCCAGYIMAGVVERWRRCSKVGSGLMR